MKTQRKDCIVVGYNDVDIDKIVTAKHGAGDHSGAFRYLRLNAARHEGRWMHMMNFLNSALHQATGKDYDLHIMDVPALGVYFVGSYLAKHGFDVEILNFFNKDKQRLAQLLADEPRAVAISSTCYVELEPAVEIIEFVRSVNPRVPIIVGGHYIFEMSSEVDQFTQEYVLDRMGADVYVCDREGEDSLVAVVDALHHDRLNALTAIDNVIIRPEQLRKTLGVASLPFASPPPPDTASRSLPILSATDAGGTFVRTRVDINSGGLDKHFVDWSGWQHTLRSATARLRSARSCPFSCAFCTYPVLEGPLTWSSIDTLAQELREAKAAGITHIEFIDDTFNVPVKRFKEILRLMIRERFEFGWFSFFRVSHADDEVYDLMQQSGCKGVCLGIESGDQRILDNMDKRVTVERYREGIRKLKERGIIVYASFVVGFPGETEQTVKNTIRFIQQTQPTFFGARLYFHHDSVPIASRKAEFGLRGAGYSWQHNGMDWRRAAELMEHIYRSIDTSIPVPRYMFGFWSLLYLMGQGIGREHLEEFLRQGRPFLLRNLDHDAAAIDALDQRLPEPLLAVAHKIAEDMERAGHRRGRELGAHELFNALPVGHRVGAAGPLAAEQG